MTHSPTLQRIQEQAPAPGAAPARPLRPLRRQAALWRGVAIGIWALALPLSIVLASNIGATSIPLGEIARILLNHTGLFHFRVSATDDIIIWSLRVPRVFAGALVGAALAAAGTLFQGLLRNPLADPYLLGISSGAALGATVALLVPGLVLIAGFYGVPVLAFLGALLAIALVYWLARVGSRSPVTTLILAGVAVSALLGAVQTLIISQNAAIAHAVGSLYLWLAGGIGWNDPAQLTAAAILILLGLAGALLLAPVLDTFALGEEGAAHLGVAVERAKLGIVAVAALLVAAAVSISGLVGFVGLFVPHMCRLLIGPRHRTLLPVAMLAGAVFLIWADVLARWLIRPAELPLGVITALAGGPFFLWLLRQASKDYRY